VAFPLQQLTVRHSALSHDENTTRTHRLKILKNLRLSLKDFLRCQEFLRT